MFNVETVLVQCFNLTCMQGTPSLPLILPSGRRAPDTITEEVPGCTDEAGCTTKRSTTTTANGLTTSSSSADEGKTHKRPPNLLHALHTMAAVLLSPYRARVDVLVQHPHVAAAWRLAKGHPLAAVCAAATAVAIGGCLAVVALLELLLLPLLALPGLAVGFVAAFAAAAVGRLQYGLASSRTRRQHKALGKGDTYCGTHMCVNNREQGVVPTAVAHTWLAPCHVVFVVCLHAHVYLCMLVSLRIVVVCI